MQENDRKTKEYYWILTWILIFTIVGFFMRIGEVIADEVIYTLFGIAG